MTEIAIALAQEAGAAALARCGSVEGTLKHDGTLVTQVDAHCERLIRAQLRRHFPDHTIFGEELGFDGPADNDWIWYLDPIDGTSNYIFDLPVWGVSIGVAHEGRPVAGAFHMPLTGQTWWAWRGGGAFCNGQRLCGYHPTEMNRTDLVCVSSTIIERYEFSFPQKLRCHGSAAHALATMAGGSYAAVVHDSWHLHDLAAGLVMCQETGTVVTQEDGTTFESFDGVDPCGMAPLLVIAGPAIHARVLRTIRRRG